MILGSGILLWIYAAIYLSEASLIFYSSYDNASNIRSGGARFSNLRDFHFFLELHYTEALDPMPRPWFNRYW